MMFGAPPDLDPRQGMKHAEAAELMRSRGYSQVLTAAGPRDLDDWATGLAWADAYVRFWKTSSSDVLVERRPDGTMPEAPLCVGVWTFLRTPDADRKEADALEARTA